MKTFQNTLAIALTTITIGLGVLSTSGTASAFEPGRHFHHRIGHCFNFCRHPGSHWHPRIGWHYHHRWGIHVGFRWEHRWGHRWTGYRHVVHVGPRIHGIPVVAGVCPPGTHLGYEGKFCWPNR